MDFTCPRCDYKTNKRSNFIKHLTKRKTICPPTVADISLDYLINEYTDTETFTKLYKCETCDKEFNSRSGIAYHKKSCCIKKDNTEMEGLKDTIETLIQRIKDIKTPHVTINNNNSGNATMNVNITTNNITFPHLTYHHVILATKK